MQYIYDAHAQSTRTADIHMSPAEVRAARLEAACERALLVSARSYGAVKSILDNRLDGQPVRRRDGEVAQAIVHPNIRGSTYYY